MPRYAPSLTAFNDQIQHMLGVFGLSETQQTAFFAYWRDEGDVRAPFDVISELLDQQPAKLLLLLSKEYRSPMVRPDTSNLDEATLIHAAHMGLADKTLNTWIPIQKVGIGLIFAHFIPTIPHPEVDPYLAGFVTVSPQDYLALHAKWSAANIQEFSKVYPPKKALEGPLESKDIPAAILADEQIEGPHIHIIKSLSVDADMGIAQFTGFLPEPYESWNVSRDSVSSQSSSVFTLDNLEYIASIDAQALRFNANELNFAPFKGNETDWIRESRVLPLFVHENFVLMGGPTADRPDTQQIVTSNLVGWVCVFTRIPLKVYQQLFHIWNVTQPVQTQGEVSADAMPIIPFEGELSINVDQQEAAKDSAWVKDFVGRAIGQAIERGASDVHIEPIGERFRIRYRLDGRLQQLNDSFHVSFIPYVINRIKTMAEMDVSEHRRGQDGRMKVNYNGRTIDIRIATCPVENGNTLEDVNETATLRILDPFNYPSTLESIIDDKSLLAMIRQASHAPSGILIVTGPTGSGKSTTLYTIINELNTDERNIITLEDPVERRLIGVNQTSIKKPNTFADSLRIALRRDPDVILVGEVRDSETAELIVKASRTGHLVFTSLHTDSSIGAIQRLRGIGVGESEMADALQLITGQRLIRKLCMSCRRKRDLSRKEIHAFKDYGVHSDLVDAGQCYESQGCSFCNGTGYKGRFAVTEVLPMTEEVKAYLEGAEKFNAYELYNIAVQAEFIPLYQHALQQISRGMTDFREVVARVPESKATLMSRSKLPALET